MKSFTWEGVGRLALASALILSSLFGLSACNGPEDTTRQAASAEAWPWPKPKPSATPSPSPSPSPSPTVTPSPTPTVTPTPSPTVSPTPTPTLGKVLLFNGTGVNLSDWQTTEQIVLSQGLSYDLINSSQMNALTLDQLAAYSVIIVPGGDSRSIASGLSSATAIKIRQAVRDRGVGYVGFCAGAWVAVGPEAYTDSPRAFGFAVAADNVLPFWYPNGNTSLTTAITNLTFADGTSRYMVWWSGPSTPDWHNGIVARYSDGAPAISELFSGKGLVVVSGTHPEAPQSWRDTAGYDPDGLDYDYAVAMIRAAMTKIPMRSF